MSITAVSSSNQTSATWQTHRPGRGDGALRKAFDAAAQAFGMSTDGLRTALKSGQSMSSLAQSKGVSTDTLTSAISSALSSANSSLSASQATEMAQRLIAGPHAGQGRPDGPPPGGNGGPPAIGSAMDSLANTLEISPDDLRSELHSGQSLTDVAAAHGMNADTLKTTLTDALTKAYSSLSSDQASSLADDLIAGPGQHNQQDTFSRLMFDMRLSGPDTSSTTGSTSSSMTQAALQMLYDRYSASSSTSQLVSTL